MGREIKRLVHKEGPAQFVVEAVYGHVEIRAWMEWDGDQLIGMGCKTSYDEHGNITSVKIEPTGVTARIK